MNCDISRFTKWDRKNYFYPDLPKAYQISQMPRPVCLSGNVKINVGGKEKDIRINRIHLEEDAGKLVHDEVNRISLADYNRCGVPLIEIVTEPDFHSAEEVVAYLEKIMLLLQYAGICDCKMEQGSIRCDVNISIAPKGSNELGTRTELKNLNSLKAIAKAIEVEIERQEELLDQRRKGNSADAPLQRSSRRNHRDEKQGGRPRLPLLPRPGYPSDNLHRGGARGDPQLHSGAARSRELRAMSSSTASRSRTLTSSFPTRRYATSSTLLSRNTTIPRRSQTTSPASFSAERTSARWTWTT